MWWRNYSDTLQEIKIEYISVSKVLYSLFLLYTNLRAIEI